MQRNSQILTTTEMVCDLLLSHAGQETMQIASLTIFQKQN